MFCAIFYAQVKSATLDGNLAKVKQNFNWIFQTWSTQHLHLDWVEITAERMDTGDLKTQSKPPTAAPSTHSTAWPQGYVKVSAIRTKLANSVTLYNKRISKVNVG